MDKCKHGFDHACLICGFTHIDGKKVWFDWAWQEQQKVINTKHEAIESLSIAFKKMRDDSKDKQKRIDELRAEIRKLIEEYKSEEKELELKEWEQSTIYGRIAIELEQALEGGEV